MAGVGVPKTARSYAFSWARPFPGISSGAYSRLAVFAVTAAALLFPLVNHNDADIDSAANALAFAALALGLNIVVGFSGLLDLGYAAFFALGAYTYGLAASFQLKIPWSVLWQPFEWLGQVSQVHFGNGDVAQLHFSYWIMLPIAGLLCAGFGLLFGAPT